MSKNSTAMQIKTDIDNDGLSDPDREANASPRLQNRQIFIEPGAYEAGELPFSFRNNPLVTERFPAVDPQHLAELRAEGVIPEKNQIHLDTRSGRIFDREQLVAVVRRQAPPALMTGLFVGATTTPTQGLLTILAWGSIATAGHLAQRLTERKDTVEFFPKTGTIR